MLGRLFGYIGRLWGGNKPPSELQPQSHADSKQKWSKEKEDMDQELQDARKQYEDEISKLKEKLRIIRSSSSADVNQQLGELEEDLNKNWQEKSDRLVAAASAKQQKALDDSRTDQDKLQEQLNATQQKYENLRIQAATMKERYEGRIRELESHQGAPVGGMDKELMSAKVKQIMSTVYHDLKGQFDADTSYKGQEINTNIMTTIKGVTLRMMQDDRDDDIMEASETHSTSAAAEKQDPLFSEDTSKPVPSSGDPSNQPDDLTQKVAALQHLVSQHEETPVGEPDKLTATIISQEGADMSNVAVGVIVPKSAPITGDKGNPYRAEELRKLAQESDLPLKVDMITVKTAHGTGGGGTITEEGEPAIKVACVESPSPTGGWGNPHREAEILRQGPEA